MRSLSFALSTLVFFSFSSVSWASAKTCEDLFGLATSSVLPALQAELTKNGFDFSQPVVQQAALGILTLMRDLPASYGQTQTVQTLFGTSSLTKKRVEWGLLAGQKTLTQKRATELYKTILQVFESLGVVQKADRVPDKEWIQGGRIGNELGVLIREVEPVQLPLTEKPLEAMTSEKKAMRLTGGEKKKLATKALSISEMTAQSQAMIDALLGLGFSKEALYLPDTDGFAAVQPKDLTLSQLKSVKEGRDDVVTYAIQLNGQPLFVLLDGLFIEKVADPTFQPEMPWSWNAVALVAESRFDRAVGTFKGTTYRWRRFLSNEVGLPVGATNFPLADLKTVLASPEVLLSSQIQRAVSDALSRYDLAALGTRRANETYPGQDWNPRTDDIGEVAIRLNAIEQTEFGFEIKLSLWKTFRMLVFAPEGEERRPKQVWVLFRLKMNSNGTVLEEPGVEFVTPRR